MVKSFIYVLLIQTLTQTGEKDYVAYDEALRYAPGRRDVHR
jgi:hypothetical protein